MCIETDYLLIKPYKLTLKEIKFSKIINRLITKEVLMYSLHTMTYRYNDIIIVKVKCIHIIYLRTAV